MFAKLLKHEWRSSRRVLGLLCITILTCGAMIGGSGFYLAWSGDRRAVGNDSILTMLFSLLLMAAIFAIGICCVGGAFYLIWRYYCSRFTDEGYLTFTLPVNHHQLLLSSILNTVWGCILLILAAGAAMVIAFALLLVAYNQEIIWADTFYAVRRLWPDLMASLRENWKVLVTLCVSGAVSGIATVVELMLAVTIGAMIAKRHKLLAAVGVLYGINLLQGALSLPQLIRFFEVESILDLLGYPCLMGSVTIAAGYFLMYWLSSRKLNLA